MGARRTRKANPPRAHRAQSARVPITQNGAYQQRVCDLELELTVVRERLSQIEYRETLLEHYRDLFEHAPLGALVLDEIGTIHEANGELRSMLSPKTEGNLDGPFIRFVTREKGHDFLNHLYIAKHSQKPVHTDLLLRSPEGGAFPVEMISVPISADRGFTRLRTLIVEISQRAAVKEALAKTEHNFQALVDASQGMFWEADANTLEITYMSASAQQILGYRSDAWCKADFFRNHIHAEERERVTTAMARLSRTPSPHLRRGKRPNDEPGGSLHPRSDTVVLEFRMIASDRRAVWMHCTLIARMHEGTKKLLGVGVDITHRKLAEARLQQAHQDLEKLIAERTAQLRETVAQLETFSYSLSHDMRAPLRSMHGFCEMLRDRLASKLSPFEADLFQRVINSSTRLDRLIQDVLHYSQVSRAPIELKPVQLDELLDSTLRDYAFLQTSGAAIEIDKPLLPVLGHEAFLTQCFSNLLSNAVKFVPPGSKPRVRVRTEPLDSQVRVWVEDNGIGIAPEAQKRVFSIFQRLHQAPNLYEGTGLGLAIVQKAVERMGGRVGVESKPGQGSRFWFQLQGVESRD